MAAKEFIKRTVIYSLPDGSKTIQELGEDGLVFKDTGHMLHALVSGRLGARVSEELAAHACMLMSAEAEHQAKNMRLREVENAIQSLKLMSPDELHALSSGAYRELCERSQNLLCVSQNAPGVTPGNRSV